MKTRSTLAIKKSIGLITLVTGLMICMLLSSPVYGQSNKNTVVQEQQKERIIKGVISDEKGPLESANVILKGTTQGTVTNDKGEFTFPKPLKTNDILLVSFIGYETVEVKIEETTTFITLKLTEDLVEFIGELNTNKLYKSKRSKKKN